MPSALEAAGAIKNPSRFAPIHINRMFTGYWTMRNPLREAAIQHIMEIYGGARFDSIIDGLNAELTNKLTLGKRPGASIYNSQTFPAINAFYEFRIFSTVTEIIKVMADTASTIYDATGPNTKSAIFTKGAGAGQTN